MSETTRPGFEGMTKREYYAAHCPLSIKEAWDIISGASEFAPDSPGAMLRSPQGALEFYTKVRFEYADAMIAAGESDDD